MKQFWLIPVILISCAIAAHAEQRVEPPTLVPCATDSTCDRDPKHLENFVATFYQWYVDTRMFIFNARKQGKTFTRSKLVDDLFLLQKKQIYSFLSPDFLNSYQSSMVSHDGQKGAPLCRDTDSFVLLCTVNIPDEWLGAPLAHLVYAQSETAYLTLSLPPSQLGGIGQPAYRLDIQLKAVNGGWHIDQVTDLTFPVPQSDK